MNLKQSLACIALATGSVFGFVAPSFAGSLTPSSLGLDTFDPSKPIVGNDNIPNAAPTSGFPYKANMFSFDKDTKVKFSVLDPSGLGSRGKAFSNFGFLTSPVNGQGSFTSIFSETTPYDKGSNDKTNDWLGTCGKAIQGVCETTITFKAGVNYLLALNTDGRTHFGVGALDQLTFNHVSDQFYPQANKYDTVYEKGALFIGMEDGLYKKGTTTVGTGKTATKVDTYWYDYQDWVVKAEAVPEPTTLTGLGMVAGGMLLARRRKASTSA
jgi:hypothetical protein